MILAGAAGFFCFPYLIVKYGKKSLSVIIPYLLISSALSILNAGNIPVLFTPAVLGITGGYTFLKKKNVQFFIITAALLLSCINVFQHYYMINVMHFNLDQELRNTTEQFVNSQKLTDDQKAEVFEDMKFILVVYRDNVFFFSFVWAVLFSVISMFLYKLMFMTVTTENVQIEGMEKYQLNEYLIFLFIIFLAGTVLIKPDAVPATLDGKKLIFAARNGLLIVSFLYLLQSLGIFKFFLIKLRIPAAVLPLSVFTFLIMGKTVIVFGSILLAGIGLLDLWADFRKLNVKPDDNPADTGN
ncbi:MAG: DUF2232 domain-containing protein [Spirochaetes bacterium]|nr:DUF2232 domain-containing protein [Spirochaetota bacterium]